MRLTPDGKRYLRMAAGEREPMPFHLRFGMPMVCRQSPVSWASTTWLSIAACAVLTGGLALQRGATEAQAVVAALLWAGLPSVRFLAAAPVLVDGAGMALALAAAVLWPIEPVAAALAVVLGACVWEKAPIFAAVFAWHPALLAALAVPALRRLLSEPGPILGTDPLADTLRRPLKTGLSAHRARWRDPWTMALPWGACLAAIGNPEPWWLVAVALAYSQLLLATDSVRLYQHAAPAVCVAACFVIPPEWAVPILLAHWLNPWAGNGV